MTFAPPSASRWNDLGGARTGPGPPAHQLEAFLVDGDDADVLRDGQVPAQARVPVQDAELDLVHESRRLEDAEESERDREADQAQSDEEPKHLRRPRLGRTPERSRAFRGAILARDALGP